MRLKISIVSVFFFSSRRRHTRSLCDWSTEVCSSDLMVRIRAEVKKKRERALRPAVNHGKPLPAVCHVRKPSCNGDMSLSELARYLSRNGKQSVKQLVLIKIP